jgi:hypothetical protein
MWDCIDGVAARGGLGVAQPWPATAEDRLQRRGWPSAARSVQQGVVERIIVVVAVWCSAKDSLPGGRVRSA